MWSGMPTTSSITGASQEMLETEVRPWIEAFLAQRGLRLSPEKTRVTHIDEGFDFLGWNFRKYRGTLLIKPSRKNAKAFYDKVAEVIKSHLTVKQVVLIEKLNPILRGWAQYHQPVVAKETFSTLDSLIHWRLTRWARRRHPKKSPTWVLPDILAALGRTAQNSLTSEQANDGTWQAVRLYLLADTVDHSVTKRSRGTTTPSIRSGKSTASTLRAKRMLNSIAYREQLDSAYTQSQSGKCALCDTAITRETGWHDHHIDPEEWMAGPTCCPTGCSCIRYAMPKCMPVGLTVVKPAPQGASENRAKGVDGSALITINHADSTPRRCRFYCCA